MLSRAFKGARQEIQGRLFKSISFRLSGRAVVCKEMRRNWIGSEINPDYVKIALERVENVTTLHNFFA